MLKFFIENRGLILSRDTLLERALPCRRRHADGGYARADRSEKKLRDNAQEPQFIRTLHGVGYQFIAEES